MQESELPSPGKLRWQCRRGMLELDYILIGFLDRHFSDLSREDQELFVRMLDLEDQLILDWVMGNVVPSDPAMRRLVGLMQNNQA
ncbi:MAG: succinate dehydrogenase assembly factor 2 [Sedimenticola sp.]|nr:succinate dehydrogenase assembly factor 2 [Sedimenticola sp.]